MTKYVPTERAFTYYSVRHDFSFTSGDCFSSLISPILDSKFAFGHMKSEVITVHVLAPLSEELHKQFNEASFIPVS